MKTGRKEFAGILSLLLIILLFNNCGGDKNGNGDNGDIPEPDKSTYEVEFTENTVVVEKEIMESFISSDLASGIYKFKDDAGELPEFQPGKVVFFYGHSVRRINSVSKEGSEIILNTEYVTLNESIKNGSIGWETKIDWSSGQSEVQKASLVLGDAIFTSETSTELKIHYEGEIQGWDISLDLEPKDNNLSIEISGSKSVNGREALTINGKGFISQFSTSMHVDFVNSEMRSFDYRNQDLKGELEIKFAAVGLGSEVAQLQIPAKIKIPLVIHGIPVSINIGCNLKIFPEVKEGASSQASYKLTYDADMGFQFSENSAQANSKLNSNNMEETGETVSAGVVTTGVGVGLEFPRFEVAILGEVIVPYFVYNTSVTTFYETRAGKQCSALPGRKDEYEMRIRS